jgi:hypothetical protein
MKSITKAKLKKITFDASAYAAGAAVVLIPVAATALYYKNKYEGYDVLLGLNVEHIEDMLKTGKSTFMPGKIVDFVVTVIPKN